jgi:hypothetical protein
LAATNVSLLATLGVLFFERISNFRQQHFSVMRSDKRSPNHDGPKHAWLSDRFLLALAFVLLVASLLYLK